MKRKNRQADRILTDQELKGAMGGTDSLSTSGDNGTGQQTDGRAIVIDTGAS